MNDPAEIFRAFQNHETFCNHSLKVQDKYGRMVPMQLGPAQKKLDAAVQRQRAKGKPVRIIYLKARQVWVSVGTAAQYFHGTPFISGQHTAVIAHDEITTANLFDHYKRFQEHYEPFWGTIKLPHVTKCNDGELEWDNGSWIKVKTARNANFGRSFTFRRVHFSELAFYNDARAILLSMMQAVPNDPDTMVVIESTANGIGNEFHRLCEKAMDPTSNSDWELVFFAWWEHPEYTLPLTMPADRFQHSMDTEERELMRLYNLTLEQIHWRRWCVANNCGGDKQRFDQEYPHSPEVAFIASGRPRFSLQHVERMPVVRDAITGGLEEDRYGVERRLVFVPREKGELTIFRKPVESRLYVIGADASEGIDAAEGVGEADPDFSVAQVLDRDTGEQVAILRARMEPAEFGRYLTALGTYYNWASMVPEANGPGISMVDEIKRQQYPAALLYHRRDQPDRDPSQRVDLIGWKTTTVTRPQLISTLDRAIREMSVLVRDPITLQELRMFVIKPNGKAEAQQGQHDDTVIALGLAIVGIEQMPRPAPSARQQQYDVKKYGGRGEDLGRRGSVLKLR